MTPAELRAGSRLSGRVFAGLVSRIEQVHGAIGGRAFGPAGPASAPVRLAHDTIARGVYFAVAQAGLAAGALGGQLLGTASLPGRGQPVTSRPVGSTALAVLNAVAGDRLGPDLAPLALGMAVRADGGDVDLAPEQVRAAFPQAGPKLAVFVHGLAETENSWRRRADRFAPYGQRLQAEFDYTPVYVRYNTGRHVSDNGHELARLLDDLAAAWPVPVQEILLAGHSMGGLVIRSACHYGGEAGAPWVARVRHVFYLGSPHLGAPLARLAGLAGQALSRVAETRPFADLVGGSSSIRDLRHGYLLDDDWVGCGPDCLRGVPGGSSPRGQHCSRDHRREVPLLAGADHYVISAVLGRGPLGAVLGDLLVQPASAHGRRGSRQHIAFPVGNARGLGGMNHFDLLNHPDVWQVMRGLLGHGS